MCTCDMRRQRYHKNHTHHTIYDFVETRVIDLKVFGQGHMLYLHFLKVRRQCIENTATLRVDSLLALSYLHCFQRKLD